MITLILNEEEFKLLENDLFELVDRRQSGLHTKDYDPSSAGLRLIRTRATIEMPLGKYQELMEELVDRSM